MMRNKIPFSWNLPQKSFRIINSILNAFTTCTEKNHMQGITLNRQFTTVFLLSIYQQWIATLGLHAKPIFTVRGKESPDKWFWAYTVQHNASQTQLPPKKLEENFYFKEPDKSNNMNKQFQKLWGLILWLGLFVYTWLNLNIWITQMLLETCYI